MKMIICLFALIAVALAAPVEEPNAVSVVRYVNDNVGLEGFKYGYVLN